MDQAVYGFAGLGRMGQPMALNIVRAGHPLVVFDPSEEAVAPLIEAGAKRAASLAELGAAADRVFLSLPTPDVVRDVCLGQDGLHDAERTRVVIDLSTTGPQMEAEVAAGMAAAGKVMIDCPVSGGVTGAENGSLALMSAGDPEILATLRPVLELMGKVFIVGSEPGMAQSMKVINNLMSTTALAISSEALVLGVKCGLEPDRMIEVLNAGSGRNTATERKIPENVLPRTFDFGFAIGLSAKDARLCLEEAERQGVTMKVGKAVQEMLNATRDTLGADVDLTNVIKLVEKQAGVEVRGIAAGLKK